MSDVGSSLCFSIITKFLDTVFTNSITPFKIVKPIIICTFLNSEEWLLSLNILNLIRNNDRTVLLLSSNFVFNVFVEYTDYMRN